MWVLGDFSNSSPVRFTSAKRGCLFCFLLFIVAKILKWKYQRQRYDNYSIRQWRGSPNSYENTYHLFMDASIDNMHHNLQSLLQTHAYDTARRDVACHAVLPHISKKNYSLIPFVFPVLKSRTIQGMPLAFFVYITQLSHLLESHNEMYIIQAISMQFSNLSSPPKLWKYPDGGRRSLSPHCIEMRWKTLIL